MQLRLPDGGFDIFDLFRSEQDHRPPSQRDTADHYDNVSDEDVVHVLQMMAGGELEYVGLNDDIAWIQTADAGQGYVFERNLDGDTLEQFPYALTIDQVTAAFLAFLHGDLNCGLVWPVGTPVVETKPKRRWFGR
jgi:hypothetical protein